MKNVFFSGGGTLGSVMPLLAIARKLDGVCVHWVGTHHGPEKQFVQAVGHIHWHAVASGKFRRYASLRNLIDIVFIAVGCIQSWYLCMRLRPACVVVAGGYVGVPVVWGAWMMRIPVIAIQLDNAITLALRLTAPLARSVYSVFPDIVPSIKRMTRASVHQIGIPTQEAPGQAKVKYPCDIMIIGGGTGAQAINTIVTEHVSAFTMRAPRGVLHITGRGKIPATRATVGYHAVESLPHEELLAHIAQARCVVSRAGVGSLGDYALLRTSVVLIPLPGSPQESNARYVAAHGAGQYVDQAQGIDSLLQAVDRALEDTRSGERLHQLFSPSGADTVACEIDRYL